MMPVRQKMGFHSAVDGKLVYSFFSRIANESSSLSISMFLSALISFIEATLLTKNQSPDLICH